MITKLRRHWDRLSPDETERLQMLQLRRYLADAVLPFSAHYRKSFEVAAVDVASLRTYADLERIPFTGKSDLVATKVHPDKPREFVLIPDPAVLAKRPSSIAKAIFKGKSAVRADFAKEYRPILMTSTTGRSADPVPFLYSQHDIDNLTLAGRRVMEIGGSEPEFRHLNAFPFAPHLAFWFAHYAGTGFGTFCLSTGGGKVMGTDGNVRLIQKINPDVIIGMPTFVYHLLKEAIARGTQLHNLRIIVLGGEKVPEGMRRKLRNLAAQLGSKDAAVLATYAFTESKMAWIECPPHHPEDPTTGYHLFPDLGIVEIVDPESGEQVPDGQPGEIVFTSLDSRGSSVIRYRTGDRISGGLTHERCPACGRTLPRLLGRISRVSEIRKMDLGKVKGTLVDFNELEHALDDIQNLGAWQLELRKADDDPLERDIIILHVEKDQSAPPPSAQTLSDQLQAAAEIRPNEIEFHTREEMRDRLGIGRLLKEEKIADNRPGSKPHQKTQKLTRANPHLTTAQ